MFTLPDGWSQDAPYRMQYFGARLFRDSEGLVCPVHRRRMGPAINAGRGDHFHQLSSGIIHVFHCLGYKTRIPGGMQVGCAAFSQHQDAVSAPIVLDVKRLMDVADPAWASASSQRIHDLVPDASRTKRL
jgi:hypothetical protein